jgi:hypothetical protein
VDAEEAALLYAPVPVENDIKEGQEGWGAFTRHIEHLLGFMERAIWPVDPDADVMPHTLMPFEYHTETGEEDEKVLTSLMAMLTLGLQGQAFKWKYKFDFDVVFSAERKAYLVLLNSVRRMWTRGLSSETPKTIEPETATAAPEANTSGDFSSSAASTE